MDKVFAASKGKNRAFALAFALLWGGLVLVNFLLPDRAFSQGENRSLAAFPSFTTARLLDGDFMGDMNTYLNDQFAGRSCWVSGQSVMEFGFGKREINDVYVAKDRLLRHYPAENADVSRANVDGVNAFAERYGMPTSVMLVPSATYIYRDELPLFAAAWDEGAYIEETYTQIDGDISAVNITRRLEEARAGYIYYRTDHHWTSYGAWLGYLEFAAARGQPLREEDLVTTALSSDFLGTNHSRTGYPFVKPDTMELYEVGHATGFETYGVEGDEYVSAEYGGIYFPQYLEQKDKYSYFLGGLQPYVTIHTGADTGRRLIIFKDSYAHCLAPMLMEDYSEIRLVDLRSFRTEDYGEFLQIERYDEALFLYSTDTFSQQLGPARLGE